MTLTGVNANTFQLLVYLLVLFRYLILYVHFKKNSNNPSKRRLILERSPNYTLELSQKSNFQPSTTKPDNIGHPIVDTGKIWTLGGFQGGFVFSGKNKKF